VFLEKTNRRIVPRWRDFLTTCTLGELGHLSGRVAHIQPSADVPTETRDSWLLNKSLWHALDLISAAYTVGQVSDPDVLEAARFIRERENSCPKAGLELARRILDPGQSVYPVTDAEIVQPERVRTEIHALRTRLVDEPRNSIAWVDLARLYAIVGNLTKAERAVEISCSLAGENRFVLRSAARFFLHSGQKDRALQLIRNSNAVSHDPWLTAAEIGVSSYASVPPRYARTARRFLEGDNVSNFSKSELASALATAEMIEGKSRTARKLFRISLVSPTDNSLAQAQWASASVGELNFDFQTAQMQVPRSYEAKAIREIDAGAWSSATENTIKWLQDQPFSSRPAAVASYLLSVIFQDYHRAERIIRSSLVSSPRDSMLLNNLAFVLLCQNRIAEGEAALTTAALGPQNVISSITLLGTAGLLQFRKGEYDEGRVLYLRAIDRARALDKSKYEAMGMLHLAQEEIRANLPTKDETLAKAERIATKQGDLDVLFVLDRTLNISKEAKESSRRYYLPNK
jgi:Tfp pilus assembly protein PilF